MDKHVPYWSNPDMAGPGRTRVLLALLTVHERDGRATVRSVASECGRCIRTTYDHLLWLRDRGLIAWRPDTAGTLRPLVGVVDRG